MMSQQIGDLISREDTLTAFADYVGSGMSMNDFDALWDIVAKMPPVNLQEPTDTWSIKDVADTLKKYGLIREQEPNTGHWIMSDDGLYRPICDKCGAHPWKGYIPTVEEATEVFKYCPNCGARMFEPQESEE